jgi:hypothetical protein
MDPALESWASRLSRWRLNWFPAYRGTGARAVFVRHDFMEVLVKLPLNWRTRNYVGTIFGGSLYGAVDPVYMIMLMKVLGRDYVVWDKAASIRFRRPGRTTLFAHFLLTRDAVDGIRTELETAEKLDRYFTLELKDAAGEVHAIIEKTINVRKRARVAAP